MTVLLGRRFTATLLVSLLVVGCASSEKPKPTPLQPLQAKIAGRQVWSTRLGKLEFPLSVAVNGATFTAASSDGSVLAFEAGTGRELWRADVRAPITAGVGSDGRFAAVVTRDNELVVLDSGQEKWRTQLASRVTTAPLVAGERVFVLGVDRAVEAFDALDGRKLWSLRRPGDALTLAQRGVVAPFKNTLLVGQGSVLAGVEPLQGGVRWDISIASPRGTNEVERLADLVGPASRNGDVVCVRAFQSAVGCVNAERGALLWSRPNNGSQGVTGDAELLFGTDSAGRVTAWRAANGEVAWSSELFLHRELSAPLAVGTTVVFGDLEGQVHFLSRDTGEPQLRLPTDGTPVVAAVAAGNTILAATRGGGLYAFRPE